MTFIWGIIQWVLGTALKPIFEFLNKRLDTQLEIRKSDNSAIVETGKVVIGGITEADRLNTSVRIAEGKFSPWVMVTIIGFMLPLAWHTWQVVLDSSRWVPVVRFWFFLPYVTVIEHEVGSWAVARLPDNFELTEHAVINSLFVGASVLLAGGGLIKMWGKR